MDKEIEMIIFKIISFSGNARSLCFEALQRAKEKDMEKAAELLAEADKSLNEAHEIQTKLLVEEAQNNGKECSLLMIHAQDHFMNAATVRDLAEELLYFYNK